MLAMKKGWPLLLRNGRSKCVPSVLTVSSCCSTWLPCALEVYSTISSPMYNPDPLW